MRLKSASNARFSGSTSIRRAMRACAASSAPSLAPDLLVRLTLCDIADHAVARIGERLDMILFGQRLGHKGEERIGLVARSMTSAWDDMRIYPALLAFAARYRTRPDLFQSFAVVFEGPGDLSEEHFEQHLWKRLQSLSDKDAWLGHPWDARVAADPGNPHFSLSFAGEAFFVVGLHPRASRPARRLSSPALVFNLHAQFEQLRGAGRYEKLRSSILQRDEALAGSVNPMLARHGEVSEARQYSGRVVDEGWRCPFRPRTADAGVPDVR